MRQSDRTLAADRAVKAAVAPLLAAAEADKTGAPVDLGFSSWAEYAEWWWGTAHQAIVDHGMTLGDLRAACAGANCALRPGCAELLQALRARRVPLVVVSAGLTDVISEIMRMHLPAGLWPVHPMTAAAGGGGGGLDEQAPPGGGGGGGVDGGQRLVSREGGVIAQPERLNLVSVVSNTMVFTQLQAAGAARPGDEAAVAGFAEDRPIHWLNKAAVTLPLAGPGRLGLAQKVVVLLGDSLKDVLMVDGLPAKLQPKSCVRIGFLNVAGPGETIEATLEGYLAVYDAVVVGDGPLDFATAVVDELAAAAGAASL